VFQIFMTKARRKQKLSKRLITANWRAAPVCLLTVISQDTQDLRIEGGFRGGGMQMASGRTTLEKRGDGHPPKNAWELRSRIMSRATKTKKRERDRNRSTIKVNIWDNKLRLLRYSSTLLLS